MSPAEFYKGALAQQNQAIDRTRWGSVTAAVIATFAAVTPGFSIGALTAPIAKEFDITTPVIGILIACFFAVTAIGSLFSTKLAERLSPKLQISFSTLLAGIIMMGISHVSQIAFCALLLIVGGLANSLVQPSVGSILRLRVSRNRISLTSGLVQAASGAAALPSFLLLRYLADPYGWRVALMDGGEFFSISSIFVYVLALDKDINVKLKERKRVQETVYDTPSNSRALCFWTLGAALGTVGVTGISSFFISITTAKGLSVSVASLALVVSILVAVIRIVAGVVADWYQRTKIAIVISSS